MQISYEFDLCDVIVNDVLFVSLAQVNYLINDLTNRFLEILFMLAISISGKHDYINTTIRIPYEKNVQSLNVQVPKRNLVSLLYFRWFAEQVFRELVPVSKL